MKPGAEYIAYKTAQRQLANDTFVSLHACKQDVKPRLLWWNSELVETGIKQALKEHRNE